MVAGALGSLRESARYPRLGLLPEDWSVQQLCAHLKAERPSTFDDAERWLAYIGSEAHQEAARSAAAGLRSRARQVRAELAALDVEDHLRLRAFFLTSGEPGIVAVGAGGVRGAIRTDPEGLLHDTLALAADGETLLSGLAEPAAAAAGATPVEEDHPRARPETLGSYTRLDVADEGADAQPGRGCWQSCCAQLWERSRRSRRAGGLGCPGRLELRGRMLSAWEAVLAEGWEVSELCEALLSTDGEEMARTALTLQHALVTGGAPAWGEFRHLRGRQAGARLAELVPRLLAAAEAAADRRAKLCVGILAREFERLTRTSSKDHPRQEFFEGGTPDESPEEASTRKADLSDEDSAAGSSAYLARLLAVKHQD